MVSEFTATPEQEQLILLPDGYYLVHAPPGTGKTEVLTNRIVHLLSSDPTATFRILALTFTTKAAEVLRSRVDAALGDIARRVNACTFHSFCLEALRHYGHFVEFAPDTTVYDNEAERLDILRRGLVQEGLELDLKKQRKLLVEIGRHKRALTPPTAVRGYHGVAYAAYNRVLRQYHGCDFDDLLWLAWQLFTEAPRVARHYRRLYRHIMVDEAQDTSRAQYEILRAICGDNHASVMLVADSDQFIYRFAGASDRWLKSFVRDFGAQRYTLCQNFRSAAAIIEVATRLIETHPGRMARPEVHPAKPAPGNVQARVFADEAEEAIGVVRWCKDLLKSGLNPDWLHPSEENSLKPEEVCVLARNRYALDRILDEFDAVGSQYHFNAGRSGMVETPQAQLVIQGIRLIQNPADRVTRESILAEWSEDLLEAHVVDLPIRQFFQELRAIEGAEAISKVFDDRGFDSTEGIDSLVRSLIDVLDATVREQGDNEGSALLAADAKTLRERWTAYSGRVGPESRSVGGFLGELALAGRSVVEGPGIRVLTVHATKGLEFKAVALVGMNEGTLPDYRSIGDEEKMADELRIAYVAITRASRTLFLTRPRLRLMPWGDQKYQRESRFIGQMGLEMPNS